MRSWIYVFDILQLNGKDLRSMPLHSRKLQLKRLIPEQPSALLYVDHIEQHGERLFHLACREDLEGMIAEWRVRPWIKIKNPAYTQIVGRQELFEKKKAAGNLNLRQESNPVAMSCHMNPFCQIEYVSYSSDDGMTCGKPAVADCADCGASICSDCRFWCCGDSFCEHCYDYHGMHSCVKKPVQNERYLFPTSFGSSPNKAS